MQSQKQQTISRLKNSLEMANVKLNFALGCAIFGIPCLLFAIGTRKPDPSVPVMFLLGFLIITGICLWLTLRIFRKAEQYIFCKCELTQPHSSPLLRSFYFTVAIQLPDRSTKIADTHAIFASHGIVGPLMEDYVNSTVTVAYNPATGMVVVIG